MINWWSAICCFHHPHMETSLMIASAGKWLQILTTLDANDY